jgi:hypothetical protein
MKSFKEFLNEDNSIMMDDVEVAIEAAKSFFGRKASDLKFYQNYSKKEFTISASNPEKWQPNEKEFTKYTNELKSVLNARKITHNADKDILTIKVTY